MPTPSHSAFAHEMQNFIDSLDDRQATFIGRLLGEFLTSIPEEDDVPDALPMIRQSSVDIKHVVDKIRERQAHDSDFQPYQVQFPNPGHLHIVVSPRLNSWNKSQDMQQVQWAKRDDIRMVTCDLGKLRDISSSALAWLVNVATTNPQKCIMLHNASETIQRSIKTLKLGQFLRVNTFLKP
jgi:hypothetical protein